MDNIQQEEIIQWFNKTYTKRGKTYLRPTVAYTIFIKLINLKAQENYLDLACGLGRMLALSKAINANSYGIDISEVAVKYARSKFPQAHICSGNAEILPYPANFFDALTCIGSLERMLNLDQVFAEIKRVTKTQARICFMVRNSNTLTWYIKSIFHLINNKGHQGAKTLNEWSEIFIHNGFEIIKIYPDQWLLKKILFVLSFGFYQPFDKVLNCKMPPLFTYEYIFLLKKKTYDE